MKLTNKTTFGIAKALHHANAASFYFDYAVGELNLRQESKALLKRLSVQSSQIVRAMINSVPEGGVKETLRREMQDPLSIDGFTDTFVKLNAENRIKAEEYLNHLNDTQAAKAIRAKLGYSEEYVQGLVQGKEHFEQLIKEKEAELKFMKLEYDFYLNVLKQETISETFQN